MTPEDIGDIFQELEDNLFALAIRNIKRHENWEEAEGFKWTQWQAEQIAGLREYRKNVQVLTDYHFDKAKDAIKEYLKEAYDESVDDAENTARRLLGRFGLNGQMSQNFFGVNSNKLDIIINEAVQNVDTKRYAAINRMNSGYTDFLRRADMFAQSGSYTIPQAVDMASKDFLAAGLNCVEYSNGNRVNIASYTEMALRTSSAEVTRQANGDVRDEFGEYLVVSNVIGMTCPICQKWQGKVMIDDVYADGKPDGEHPLVSDSKADGFMHPNCRHQLFMYIEGITEVADLPNDVETKEHYKAEQEQRRQEREIRKYKRLRDGAMDPDNKKAYAARVKEWIARHDRFLQDHEYLRKNPKRLAPGFESAVLPEFNTKYLKANDSDLFQKETEYKRMKVPEEIQKSLRREVDKFNNTFGDISDYSKHIFLEPLPSHNELGFFNENSGRIVLRGYENVSLLQTRMKKNYKSGLWSTPSVYHPVRHEMTHAWIYDQIRLHPNEWAVKKAQLNELYESFMNDASGLIKTEGVKLREAYGRLLSYYASENLDEFIAEGVAEYLNGGTRPLSRQIVKILLGG